MGVTLVFVNAETHPDRPWDPPDPVDPEMRSSGETGRYGGPGLVGYRRVMTVNNRYIIPFVRRGGTSYGTAVRPTRTARCFEDRIIFLGVPGRRPVRERCDGRSYSRSRAPTRTANITIYINSPGGSYTAMTAIYDTMQYIRPEHLHGSAFGQAASAAALLLAGGTPGKRLALPKLAHPDPPAGRCRAPRARGSDLGDPGPARSCGWRSPDGGAAGPPLRQAAGAGHA